ncbi:hypothetical protein [Stenotrophomonas lactitubi]|nr:hypothetical protein [Stenotrophomonas lactitubi]
MPAVLAGALLAAAGAAGAQALGAAARASADGWVGREASQLLMQLRVDGGRVQIEEDDETLETRYTWRTVVPAYTEQVKVGGGEFLYMEPTGTSGQRAVYAPIIVEDVHHAEEHRCDITYIADRDGVVRRWQHRGPRCDIDIVGPDARRPNRSTPTASRVQGY